MGVPAFFFFILIGFSWIEFKIFRFSIGFSSIVGGFPIAGPPNSIGWDHFGGDHPQFLHFLGRFFSDVTCVPIPIRRGYLEPNLKCTGSRRIVAMDHLSRLELVEKSS